MVRGRRGRVQKRNIFSTRSATFFAGSGNIDSVMKKENNLDIGNEETNASLGVIHPRSIACKSLACNTSLFSPSITNLPCSDVSENKDIVTDVGNFVTDETPVAVPINGPSTPHKITMPNENRLDDLDEDKTFRDSKDENDKKLTFNSVQQTKKKLAAGRGRRKFNNNQLSNHRPADINAESKNRKLTEYFPVRRSVRKSKKTVLEEKQRDMENKVLCQVEEGLKIQQFVGKGRGVITTQKFEKGDFVVEYIGELIDQVTAKKREKLYAQDQSTGCYMYYFQHRNHQYCVDATTETGKLGRLVNHSRNGNLIARVVEVESTPHLVLTAKEDIPIGAEVTYDYGDRSREAIRHHPWLAL